MKELIRELNQQQREAVLYFDSPLLILAGAGSGKTRVITYKIAYMIEELGFEPERILAVTFTNKAANEMKERLEGLLKREVPVWVMTFHSFCVRLLRAHSVRLGYKPNFVIFDSDDKKRLIKEIIKDLNLDPDLYSPSTIASVISNVKNGTYSLDSMNLYYENIGQIFELYNKRLKESNALDFDDLLICGRDLLAQEDLKRRYSDYFRYVLIDEYQDTNRIQYEIALSLTKEKGNICVVGDEDQCIYTWRGANIENILSFERDFPNAKVIKLEKNYRCSGTILKAANAVIANNRKRKGKTLFTENPDGEPIRLFAAESDVEESQFISSTIKQFLKKGVKPSDIAVFYRTNAQSRILEDALRKEGIAYQIVGGVKFYERKEIKDVIAYLRVALFDSDVVSLLRILNVPKRGLGDAAEKKLKEILKVEKGNLKALEKLAESVSSARQRKAVEDLIEIIRAIREKIPTLPPYDLIKFITTVSGYKEYLQKEYREDWESRYENIEELGNTIQDFAEREKLEGEELYVEFLSTITLSSDQDEMEEGEKVTLMTVHASKGLEFPVVFIAGLEEGIFPHVRSLDSADGVEEERRLFYVAVTRAKKLLSLSYAKRRRFFGTYKSSQKSRFLDEIPSHLIKEVKKKERSGQPALQKTSSTSDKKPKIVFHKKFGKGVVKRVEGSGDNAKVTAFFANYGEKTVIMKFLKVLA
ncbi:DNA helicase-2 / ATP-dependent DNA helicase PcrA [Desulfurobacterium pacificum]|uniref:DNA 3'-5' helicase n=1 Tax=Desulfurobacterium pacificum TaxID=240166 RepID=A0ABY1NPQ3_9BACT|nr:UvrD-helicase domain-containing protein [Desulfurobacterium pacificum]SMP14981.1 DNA helicase-2 / ATP-dependent DNA helicase PcrA [Desulfurobacterium pacificum]